MSSIFTFNDIEKLLAAFDESAHRVKLMADQRRKTHKNHFESKSR
jgi:hypothetical protein